MEAPRPAASLTETVEPHSYSFVTLVMPLICGGMVLVIEDCKAYEINVSVAPNGVTAHGLPTEQSRYLSVTICSRIDLPATQHVASSG